MRYAIALVVAVLLIAAGALFVRLTFRSFEAKVRESLRQQQQAGTLPPELQGADIESVNVWQSDMMVKVPRGEQARLEAAMLLSDTWYIWAPLVLAVCLGAAALAGRRRGRA